MYFQSSFSACGFVLVGLKIIITITSNVFVWRHEVAAVDVARGQMWLCVGGANDVRSGVARLWLGRDVVVRATINSTLLCVCVCVCGSYYAVIIIVSRRPSDELTTHCTRTQ